MGTTGFQAAGRSTYGDTNKAVGGGGVMAGFGELTPEQLVAVVMYERITFGGQNPDDAALDCGLVAPEGEEPADDETAALDG